MRAQEFLNEALGNLSQLNVGSMINVLRQSMGGGKAFPGSRSFRNYVGWQGIGNTSKIIDAGVLKSGIKGLRKMYREHTDEKIKAVAIYVGGKAVSFGMISEYDLAGTKRESLVAYDFTSLETDFENAQKQVRATLPKDKVYSTSQHPTTTAYQEEPDTWQLRNNPRARPKRFTGTVVNMRDYAHLLDIIDHMSKQLNQPVTVKLVTADTSGIRRGEKRRQLQGEDILTGGETLKTRLTKYKLNKKPTVENVEDFIHAVFNEPGKVVKFGGLTYKLSTTSKFDGQGVLSGKSFDVQYDSVDPGINYKTVTIKFYFNRDTMQIVPFYVSYWDKTQGDQFIVLDDKGYIQQKYPGDAMNKNLVIKDLLNNFKMYADYKDTARLQQILNTINSLQKLGYDWPELDTVKNSVEHETDLRSQK